jgi:hypothetical protein
VITDARDRAMFTLMLGAGCASPKSQGCCCPTCIWMNPIPAWWRAARAGANAPSISPHRQNARCTSIWVNAPW